jgi:hypothetical protein
MPNTYDLISTTVLTSAASIIRGTLPSTYTDIQIRASLRSVRATNIDGFEIYFNTDSANNYGRIALYNEDGANSQETQRIGSSTGKQIGGLPAANLASSLFNQATVDLLNYSSNAKKIFYSYHSTQRTGGSTRNIWRTAGVWDNTSPITQFTFVGFNGNLEAGSAISIYGIKKA